MALKTESSALNTALQLSTRDVTRACTSVFAGSVSSDRRVLRIRRSQYKHGEQIVETCHLSEMITGFETAAGKFPGKGIHPLRKLQTRLGWVKTAEKDFRPISHLAYTSETKRNKIGIHRVSQKPDCYN